MQAPFVQIVIVKPDGYIHSEAFAELAETLHSGMKSLGIEGKVVENRADPAAANIVLGWHLLREEQSLPQQCILYNLEQMDDRNQAMRERLIRLAKRCEVWDYSLRNIEILYQHGFPALLRHVPIGSVPSLARIAPAPEQDIDVLFYGSMNPRRAQVIEELKRAGLNVRAAFGVYGSARDALIARAKVVLNLHFYDTSIFEMVRVSYLWINRKAVVAECNQATELEGGLEGAACFVPYDQLVKACQELVKDSDKRHALEERAFAIMSARDEASILRRVFAGEAEVPLSHAAAPATVSLVVNTWNEEKMLPGLLDSCEGIDEIVVADMNSTDRTIEIASGKRAKIVALPFAGGTCVEPGRQMALAAATGDWILVLDADERLPQNGLQRLRQIIANSPADVSAYSLAFQVFVGSTRIRATGWEPRHERHVRLFRRGRVQWPALVHAVPQVDGRVVEIAEDDVWVVHHNFSDLAHFIDKTNRYSSVEAREMLEAGKSVSLMAGLSEGLQELIRRYSPEQDGALSFALAFGILAYKVLNHAKACEIAGWPTESVPSTASLGRAVEAFARELSAEMIAVRPLGVAATEADKAGLEASIIIPVHNKREFTERCVAKLRENTLEGLYEAIFVDNASTDGTGEFLNALGGNTVVIGNSENRGFVEACNQGASQARGKFLVFLNNDTEPQPGWLQALLEMAKKESSIGAVGSKLVYPDGRLQEAGGIIFRDGSGWNFGRFDDPSAAAYNQACEVDYCSGASLMVCREVFERLGGFDRRYAPAYYEDTDLCFGIRSLGLKVMYCPLSTVVHFEGITAGTDLNSGFKRYQAINRGKFVAKWAAALALQGPPPSVTRKVPATADRARLVQPVPASGQPASATQILPPAQVGAPHVLIIDPLMPIYDIASGSLRLFRIVQLLRVLGCHVTYIARAGSTQERYRRELESLGVNVYATDPEKLAQLGYAVDAPPIDLARILSERPCQLAWLSFYDIAEQYLPDIRRLSPATTIAIDTVDVHFLRERRQAELAHDKAGLKKATVTKKREMSTYGRADLVVTVTEADAEVLRRAGLKTPIDIVPNVHAAVEATPGYEARRGLLFVGNFNHPPNIDAICWFCSEIMPRVLERLPDAKLSVVGPNPPAQVQELAGPNVSIRGWVPETGSHLDAARVSIAPLRVGAGMKGKIGEALSRGIPVVTTSIGAEGMGLRDGEHLIIADDADRFAEAVVRVHEDRATWEKLAGAGQEVIESQYGMKAVMHRLHALLVEACAASGQARQPVSERVSSVPPHVRRGKGKHQSAAAAQ